jgi:hypothetical protein
MAMDWDSEETIEKLGMDYAKAVIKSQRNIINVLYAELGSYRDEVRELRCTLIYTGAVSAKAEEIRIRRDGVKNVK